LQDSLHISPSLFLTPWCLELFFSNLPYELVIRFWDLYIMNGYTTFYRLCLALLKLNEGAPICMQLTLLSSCSM